MNQQTYQRSWRKGISLSAAFLLALIVAAACKKETNTLGAGVLNPEALLASGGVDTFQLQTYSIDSDSFATDNQSYAVLGQYNDPKTGLFRAHFYTQIHPTSTIQFASMTGLTIDSVVLSLRYKDYYGELDEQRFSVQRVTENMHPDTTYYRFSTKATDGNELVLPSSQDQVPNVDDSVLVGVVKQEAQLRLQLDPALGLELIQNAYNGTYTDDDTFDNYFKGLKVSVTDPTPSPGDGGVVYFYLNDPVTRLTVYYTQDGTSNQISYQVDGTCADFNHVDLTPSAAVQNVLDNPSAGQTQYYAQSFGSRAVVKFPGVNTLPKNTIIHDAVLVVPYSYPMLSPYYPSVALAVGYNTVVDGDSTFKAKAVTYDDVNKRYVIDMRDYIQSIVTGSQGNDGLYMYPGLFTASAERLIFNGPNSTNKLKPKLIIKYTEY